jgi:uncharacterized protein DUF4365
MECYSTAYAHAVAAAAGVAIGSIAPDINGLDVHFLSPDDGQDAGDSAHVQLKSTSDQLPASKDLPDGRVYRLREKDYDRLRIETTVPRFLVVLEVPKNAEHWLTCDPDYLRLNASARWLSLRGSGDTTYSGNVPVHIPNDNLFTPQALRDNMGSLNAK